MTRRIRIAAWIALSFAAASPVAGDILPHGSVSLVVRVRMEWGPLADRLTRPVVPRTDDTWETLATREAGDVRWAQTIRAMTGRDTPAAGPVHPAWLPPRGLEFGPQAGWWSAYVDSAKFGRDSDISRTEFHRVDPGATEIPVFGTVTFAVRRHLGPLTEKDRVPSTGVSAKQVIANPKAAGFVVAPSFEVPMSVEKGNRLRRIEQSWRVETADEENLRLKLGEEKRFDAEGVLLAALATPSGAWIAALVGAGILLLVSLFARRRSRAPA
jgi:hypothetical protein